MKSIACKLNSTGKSIGSPMKLNILWSDLRLLKDQERHVPEKTPIFMIYEINGLPLHESSYKETIVHLKHGVRKEQYGNLLNKYQVRTYCELKKPPSKYEFSIPETEAICDF